MRCTSPLYRVTDVFWDKRGGLPPSLSRKRFYNFQDYSFYVSNGLLPPVAFNRINCGQCLSCRINHAKMWSERCLLEAQYWESTLFVTLTYNDKHLPFNGLNPTLRKKDFQDFMKRLRKKLDYKVSFFASGEYGGRSKRPHYHAIIFGLSLPDMQVHKVKKSYNLYTSKFLEDVWGKGFCIIGVCNSLTTAYTAQYTLKKSKVVKLRGNVSDIEDFLTEDLYGQYRLCDHDLLKQQGVIENEFSLMSRRPAIGKRFFDEHMKDIIDNDRIDGCELKHIRYFDKLIEKVSPQDLKRLKMERISNAEALRPTIDYDKHELEQLILIKHRVARRQRVERDEI